jgi:hypothetical protein
VLTLYWSSGIDGAGRGRRLDSYLSSRKVARRPGVIASEDGSIR